MAIRSRFVGRLRRACCPALGYNHQKTKKCSSSSWPQDKDLFYWGSKIPNQVTWLVNGPRSMAQASHAYSVGMQRLWNFTNGKILDVSEVTSDEKRIIYTTAVSGTFYITIRNGDDWVTLVIDGREGWCYGFKNKFGSFEFKHVIYPHKRYMKKSTTLQDCLGDYGKKSLCPNGLSKIHLGYTAAQKACRVLSEYKGSYPVSAEVREACATLLIYGPESGKLNEAFNAANGSLLDDEVTMESINAGLNSRIHKWSTMAAELLHVTCSMLHTGVYMAPVRTGLKDVCSTESLLAEVAMVPYNRTIDDGRKKLTRKWKASLPDEDEESVLADGRPHYLSKDFVPLPSQDLLKELVIGRPEDNFIDPAEVCHNIASEKARARERGWAK